MGWLVQFRWARPVGLIGSIQLDQRGGSVLCQVTSPRAGSNTQGAAFAFGVGKFGFLARAVLLPLPPVLNLQARCPGSWAGRGHAGL